MSRVNELRKRVSLGITKEEALSLASAPIDELCLAADDIRKEMCGKKFDMCTIINAKSGRCTENCRYCAQSAHYEGGCEEYPLIGAEEISRAAVYNRERGVLRFSTVTSGKRLTDAEVDSLCDSLARIRSSCDISLCASCGLLGEKELLKLAAAGVRRYHNNLETSRRYFPQVCTTHTYDDKLAAIRAAQSAGLSVCSGGIFGLGETLEDRIDMAVDLRELGIKSVPVNILNPIKGTPFADNRPLELDEVRRSVAIYRFLLPDAAIRLAGGRGLFADRGRALFLSGANAAITGDMLTTAGISIADDMAAVAELGFEVAAL